jgi:hypothetical protein
MLAVFGLSASSCEMMSATDAGLAAKPCWYSLSFAPVKPGELIPPSDAQPIIKSAGARHKVKQIGKSNFDKKCFIFNPSL